MKITKARTGLKRVSSGSSTKLQSSIPTSCLIVERNSQVSMKRKKQEYGRIKSAELAALNTAIQLILCQCTTLVFTVTIMTHTNPLEFLDLQ